MRAMILASGLLAASAAFGTTTVQAADLPMEAPPAVVAVETFTWSGFYVGGAIGYAFSDLKVKNSGLGSRFRYNDDVDSLTGTGFVGFNYQFDSFVGGVEADLSYADFDGKGRGCAGEVCRANADNWFGTIRGRVGFAADRFLVFGTAGLAIGRDVDFRRSNTPAAFGFSKDESGTRYGYAVGGGVDYAVTDNVIVRGEYQYIDFGSEKLRAINAVGGGQPARIKQDAHLIRAGLAYKF